MHWIKLILWKKILISSKNIFDILPTWYQKKPTEIELLFQWTFYICLESMRSVQIIISHRRYLRIYAKNSQIHFQWHPTRPCTICIRHFHFVRVCVRLRFRWPFRVKCNGSDLEILILICVIARQNWNLQIKNTILPWA